jgi:hypothetical protein
VTEVGRAVAVMGEEREDDDLEFDPEIDRSQ